MKHTVIALAAAALVAAAVPNAAEAHCGGCGVAAGVVGGLAAGAIIGSAVANSAPAPVYVEPGPPPPPPAYYYEESDGGPVCHVERHRIFVDGVGWRWSREEVCD